MRDGILVGMSLGIIVGAVLVNTNKKAEKLVESGKEKLKEQINKL